MRHLLVYFLFAILAFGQAPIKFLPTEYSSITPYQFEINKNTVALQMPLCSGGSQYNGCNVSAGFNLPFTGWSIPDGTYLNFSVIGNGDACGTVLCKNNPTDPASPGTCSFIYQSKMGDRLYIVGTSGRAAGFQATFNMKITCPKSSSASFSPIRLHEKSGLSQCPQQADPTKRYVNLVTPGIVPTSPKTSDAVFYALSVCPDQKAYASVTYNCQAVDQKSAFATYFCPVSNCNTNNSPQGWFDQSGTALNFVEVTSLSSQMMYFTIYGWGQYQAVNTFVFNIQVNDQ